MNRLILARHGNTFRPEENPVWVGARSDLPLVEKGIAQAHALGSALRRARVVLSAIFCGPLQRTAETARIVAEILSLSTPTIHIDKRLIEIDYGAWESLSATEIENRGGGEEMAAWNSRSVFPATPGWSPSEYELLANVRAILFEIKDGTNLIVTSNGILRFFARVAANGNDFPDRRVSTGNVCVMERSNEGWHVVHWNQPPDMVCPLENAEKTSVSRNAL